MYLTLNVSVTSLYSIINMLKGYVIMKYMYMYPVYVLFNISTFLVSAIQSVLVKSQTYILSLCHLYTTMMFDRICEVGSIQI